MNQTYIKSVMKKHLEQRLSQMSTRLLVLQADVDMQFKKAQRLSNEQMELFAEVEALTIALEDLSVETEIKPTYVHNKFNSETLQPNIPQVIEEVKIS